MYVIDVHSNYTMSESLQVRVSRDGKELGTYSAQEAVRLLVAGTLKVTDFYWHEGMTEWAPLTQLQAAEARRQLAERALQQKQEEERKAAELAKKRREEAEQLGQEQAKAKKPRIVSSLRPFAFGWRRRRQITSSAVAAAGPSRSPKILQRISTRVSGGWQGPPS